MKVKGIREGTFSKIKDYITVRWAVVERCIAESREALFYQ